jgi:hypothetical protein
MADDRAPCSVVLEGGVTSAVIYASLLARLSRDYALRDLGGASSGAVAAAAAAAAEYARRAAPGPAAEPFAVLGQFPAELAEVDPQGRTKLFKLFQAQRRGHASLAVAMAALDAKGRAGLVATAWRVMRALVTNFSPAAALAALPVVGVGWIAADWLASLPACQLVIDSLLLCATGWLVVVLPTALAAALALVVWALLVTVQALRANHWGLCSGMDEDDFRPDHALTPTLHGFFQKLAARKPGEPPLTFGDLWGDPKPGDGSSYRKGAERLIDLQIITTCVSLARPVRLPGEPGDDPLHGFFYDEIEWARLFPPDVLAHLRARRRPVTLAHDDGRSLLALPDPEHWPVLMAARFSLSFPVLLSAVPMYIAVPRRQVLRAGVAGDRQAFEARKVYFSDGGITSNCPVHLFDAPLPAFPTFGINLYDQASGKRVRVSRSDTHDPELEAAFTQDATGWNSPLPFLWSIVSTMLGWRDSLQRSLPGYRERMVHIGVPAGAGGLNLAMTPRTIARLARIGEVAAMRLIRDFSTPRRPGEATAWERHRWSRARTTLSALRAYVAAFDEGCVTTAAEPDYAQLLRKSTPARDAFPDDTARQQALDLLQGVRVLADALESTRPPDALDQGAPLPRPKLHLSPPW